MRVPRLGHSKICSVKLWRAASVNKSTLDIMIDAVDKEYNKKERKVLLHPMNQKRETMSTWFLSVADNIVQFQKEMSSK